MEADNIALHLTLLFGLLPRYVSGSSGFEHRARDAVLCGVSAAGLAYHPPWTVACVVASLGNQYCNQGADVAGVWSQVSPDPSFLSLKLPLFLVGMALAITNHRFGKEAALATLLLLFAVLLATQSSGYITGLTMVLVFTSPWTHGVGLLARAISGVLTGLLGSGLARFLADTSYTVYLLHAFFIKLFGGGLYVNHWRCASDIAFPCSSWSSLSAHMPWVGSCIALSRSPESDWGNLWSSGSCQGNRHTWRD